MTLTGGETRVRHLINQTDSTNTKFDNTNFIDVALNQGRRMFATILPEEAVPKLRKSVALVVTAEVGAYPSDYLRSLANPFVTLTSASGTFPGRRIPENERWRLRWIDNTNFESDLYDDYYYYERSDGVVGLHNSATVTGITYEYLKAPDALSVSDNVELPTDIDDLVVDYAFQKCMGTRRGDLQLAVFLANQRNATLKERMASGF